MQVMAISWLSDWNWFGVQISIHTNSKCRNWLKLAWYTNLYTQFQEFYKEEGVYKFVQPYQ